MKNKRELKNKGRSFTTFLLAVCLLMSPVGAAGVATQDASSSAGNYLLETVTAPQVGSVGGEWTIIALARGNFQIPEGYFEAYYNNVLTCLGANDGILHEKKYTEYSRVVLALTAIGADPSDMGGYNLLMPLGDFEKTVWQGINGAAFALLALDSGDYDVPLNTGAAIQATRQMYVDEILSLQLEDGGWSISGSSGDPDMTGMALQALAAYAEQDSVRAAIERALSWLSENQDETGGYASWGEDNCESLAQVIIALCALGVGIEDPRFSKNDITLLDALISYRLHDGSFSHTAGAGATNIMTTEQALCALVALERYNAGKSALYVMDDILLNAFTGDETGLSGRNPDVRRVPILYDNVTFPDVNGADCQAAVEALAARGIINGMDTGLFEAEETMTRAQFSAAVVRALGLTPTSGEGFSDVSAGDWFAPYVGTGHEYGIIQGIGDGLFNPGGTITRQEAAVLVERAAKLCGMNTERSDSYVKDMLAQFADYRTISDWAAQSLAFCYDSGIMSQDELEVEPLRAITRGEIAQMIFNLLDLAMLT